MKLSTPSTTVDRSNRHALFRKIAGTILAAVIIAMLYSRLEARELQAVLSRLDTAWLAAVIGTFFLIFLLSAWRWKMMADPYTPLTLLECLRLTGTASCLNMILPSKMGTFVKAYGLSSGGAVAAKSSISMVIYEKLLDLAMMGVLFLILMPLSARSDILLLTAGLPAAVFAVIPAALHCAPRFFTEHGAEEKRSGISTRLRDILTVAFVYAGSRELRKTGITKIYLITLFTWMVHSIQLVLFFRMIGLAVPPVTVLANMYCAVFIGLIPITVAGIGTRDLAIVYLFNGILTYGESLSIGMISTLRYIVPMVLGFPFFLAYLFSKNRMSLKKTLSARGVHP